MPRDIGNAIQVTQGGSFPTYRAMLADYTPVAVATDIVNILNPVTSNVVLVITKTSISMTATAASAVDGYLYRRTTANSAGTPLTLTTTQQAFASGFALITQMDTNDQATQSTVVAYTTVATVGTGQLIQGEHICVPAATGGIPISQFTFDSTTRGSKPLIIRPGQSVSLGYAGNTIPSGAVSYTFVEWVEMPLATFF